MAELLATVGDSEAWHADWRELLLAMAWRGLRADLIWADAPYSEKTHGGHDDGAMTANRAKKWASRQSATSGARAWNARYSSGESVERRRINYDAWTPRDVREFVAGWAPFCAGWFVTITDHVLEPHWSHALRRAGLYVFAPIAYVAPGSRVRMVGDGPPTWCNYVVHARVRSRAMARWATAEARAARGDAPALLGAYVLPPGEGGSGKLDVVGGKPDWLHEAVIIRYSAPGGLVVDATAGGGGAGRAAMKLERRAIVGDVLREHAELCAAALREGDEGRERAAAYLPSAPRPEQVALPFAVRGRA